MANNDNVKVQSFQKSLLQLLARHPALVVTCFVLSVLIIVSSVPIAYGLWGFIIKAVFTIAMNNPWQWLWAWFIIMILAVAPIWVIMGGVWVLQISLSVSVDKAVKAAFDPVKEVERELLKGADKELLLLLKYIRIQLEAYYTIGLKQARRSFNYSVIAMWVGFVLILAGISVNYLPVEKWGFVKAGQDIKTVVIAGGIIIEFVSVIFLWVYRSAMDQLTYFYNRQIHTHNVVMCFQIATSMQNPDEAKRSIVDKVLDRAWTAPRIVPTGAKWFSKLVS